MSRLVSVTERFWSKVSVRSPEDCWPWTAGLDAYGYGWFKGPAGAVGAHRFAFELTYGPINAGVHIRHSCDNRPCVNPRHLLPGTNQDNVDDKMARGRHPKLGMTSCRNGHPYNEENTYITPREGHRRCRTCDRLATRRFDHRMKGEYTG